MGLMKVVLYTWIISFQFTAAINQQAVFVYAKNFCITNGSSAISINAQIENVKHVHIETSAYQPDSPTISNCDFESKSSCRDLINDNWRIVNSMDSPVPQNLITDRRWEDFPWNKSEAIIYGYKQYLNILTIAPPNEFRIPFSVRIKEESHIFLCDGDRPEAPSDANCYWIMIGSNGGKTAGIRKCRKGQIPTKEYEYPSEPCKTMHSKKEGSSHLGDVNELSWKHFLIERNQNTLKVFKGQANEPYLELEDGEFKPKHMFVSSYNQQGLWKIHRYSYLFSSSGGTSSHYISILGRQLCVSMFVAMCKACKLEIYFEYASKMVHKRSLTFQVDTWQEVKIFKNNINDYMYLLMTITASYDDLSSTNKFWAIDDIRVCHEPEYRFLKHSNYPCEELGMKEGRILILNNTDTAGDLNCPENTFGHMCLPCSIFYGDFCPENMDYCEYVANAIECHCSAGYYKVPPRKKCTRCPLGRYGHGCKSQCSQGCINNYCDHISGQCECNEPFHGTKCDKLSQPYLKYPPARVEETARSCSFKLINEEIVGEYNKSSRSEGYILQYRESNAYSTWKTLKYITNRNLFIIIDLKSDTEYSIRVLIADPSRPNESTIDSKIEKLVPKTTCKTKCNALTPDQIKVSPGNITASVELEVDTNGCKVDKYFYSLGSESMQVRATKFDLAVKPYTDYEIIFLCNNLRIASKPFRTKEGVPSCINNLSVYEGESKYTRKLSWQEPETKNGAIEYTVSYRAKRKGCTYLGEYSTETTQFTEMELKDLEPHSVYTGYVWAKTKAGSGPQCSFHFDTISAKKFSPKELPRISNITQANEIITIEFKKIPCKDIEGPINILISFSCSNEWCGKTYNTGIDMSIIQQVNLSELDAFSNYTFVTKATRIGKEFVDVESKNFQTHATEPREIEKVDVISKDRSYITLRWKSPYPPTGIFAGYKIKLNNKGDTWIDYETSKVTQCGLWEDYNCITITDISEQISNYGIQVYGRNKEPPGYKKLYELEVETALRQPDPPYNLSYVIGHKNEIIASWYHPTIMNGNITKFEITITDLETYRYIYKEQIVHWKNYSLTYSYKVPLSELEFCKTLMFDIRSYNGYNSEYKSFEFKTPPPEASISENDIAVVRINDSINVGFLKNRSDWNFLYVLLSDFGKEGDLDSFERSIKLYENKLLRISHPRLVSISTNITTPFKISLRNGLEEQPNQDFSLVFFFITNCNQMMTIKRLTKPVLAQSYSISEFWAFLLFLLLPAAACVMYTKKLHHKLFTICKSEDITIDTAEQLPLQPTPLIQTVNNTTVPTAKKQVPNATNTRSKRVILNDFQQYVRSAIADGTLNEQIELFPKGLLKPHAHGSAAPNKSKNRYKNVIAYDHTRVKLKKVEGEENSDYINANYIHGYKMSKAYIATQGPKECTVNDFWRMIWQENVKYIIMLANLEENGKKKVEKYWPDINETARYGNISVEYLFNKLFANYEQREFSVTLKNEKRKITQLHFISWPDHGIPLYPQSLVPFLEEVLKIPNNPRSPIVVHCSAGVGRTGTIILSDICLRMAASEGAIDFLSNLEQLRSQRANLVDNAEQYKLAHLIVLECIFGMRTSIPCNSDMDKTITELLNSDGVEKQMHYIVETEWQDRAMETDLEDVNSPICDEKNRFPDIVPDHNRIYLTCHPPSDEGSSYINAVQVDGFRSPGKFLVTQLPMPNTIKDFWRLVCEREAKIIIVIGTIDPNDKTTCQFWPSDNNNISPIDFISVTCLARMSSEHFEKMEIKVRDSLKEIEFNLKMVIFKGWRNRDIVPATVEDFLSFLLEAENMSRNTENVIITCYDGASASGLYIALSFLIEKMKTEHECDVCQAVRSIRHIRRQFVSNRAQYEFLFKACLSYIKGFELYSNFT